MKKKENDTNMIKFTETLIDKIKCQFTENFYRKML